MIFYKVGESGMITKEENIIRKTAKFVFFVSGYREGIRTQWQSYFESLDEAVEFAMNKVNARVRIAERNLNHFKEVRDIVIEDCDKLQNEEKSKSTGRFMDNFNTPDGFCPQ